MIKEFTISYDLPYQFEEGMTWEQWVNSNYNTDGFTISGNNIKMRSGYSGFVIDGNSYALTTDLVHTGNYSFGKI